MKDPEAKKTLTFILVAGMALLVAWEPWRPAPADVRAPLEVGQKLFPDFTDPLAAKSLEIVKFNEETAAIRDFQVKQVSGVWSIPSHSNYPADAKQHMADAATALMDLTILNLASDRPGDQKLYGVIAPDPKDLKVGMTGVGTRVTVRDGKDKALADLVIGKEVKDQPGLRYVRRVGKDQIFSVKLAVDKLSTKFDDWIEKDLLMLNSFDVKEVVLNDYSSQIGISQGRPVLNRDQRNLIKLGYDDAGAKWNLVELSEFDEQGKPKPAKLADDEELNTQKLNDLRNALDDLKIVDVERKPSGLSQDLRASDEFLNNAETIQSLAERGFVPVAVPPDGHREIFSSEGEVTCATKEGVRYVLRFGNLAGTSEPEDEKPADGKEAKEPKSSAPNRYLFVMAQFDESQIPKPELKPVPGSPASDKSEQPKTEDKPSAETAKKPAESAKKPVEKAADKPAEKPEAKKAPQTKTADTQEQASPKEEKEDAPTAEPKKEDAKPAEAEKEEPKKEESKEPEKPASPEELEKLAVERENKRKQEDYDSAVKRGQEKVKELNGRFADWYFIIPDDVYKKIHLGLGDIVKKKEEKKADATTEGLDNLEEGIKIGPAAKDAPQP
jgi:hypothetical protein